MRGCQKTNHKRQRVCQCFTRARLGPGEQVVSGQYGRNGLGLNRGRGFVALLAHGLQNGRGQVQFVKVPQVDAPVSLRRLSCGPDPAKAGQLKAAAGSSRGGRMGLVGRQRPSGRAGLRKTGGPQANGLSHAAGGRADALFPAAPSAFPPSGLENGDAWVTAASARVAPPDRGPRPLSAASADNCR